MPEDKDLLLKQQEEINKLKKELKKASKPSSMLSVLKNSLKQSVHDFFVREDKMKHMAEQIKTLEKKLEESNEENNKKAAELFAVTTFQSDDDSQPNDSDIPNFPQTKEAAVREYFSGIDLQTLAMQLYQSTAVKTDMPNATDTFMSVENKDISESDNSQKGLEEQEAAVKKEPDTAKISSTEKINNAKPLSPLQPNLAKSQYKYVKNDEQKQTDLQVKKKNQDNPESNERGMQSIDKKTQLENTAGKNDKNTGKYKNDVQHNCQSSIDDDYDADYDNFDDEPVMSSNKTQQKQSIPEKQKSSIAKNKKTNDSANLCSPLLDVSESGNESGSAGESSSKSDNESSKAGELSMKSGNESSKAGELSKVCHGLPSNDDAQQGLPNPEQLKNQIQPTADSDAQVNDTASYARVYQHDVRAKQAIACDDERSGLQTNTHLAAAFPPVDNTSAATATIVDKNGRKKSKTDRRNKNKKKQINENQNTNTKDSIESSAIVANESKQLSEGSELSQMKRNESDDKKQRSELSPKAEETVNLNCRAEYNVTNGNFQTAEGNKPGRNLPSINNTTNKDDNDDSANSNNGILSPAADLPEDFGIIIEPDYPSVNDMPDPSSDDTSSIFDDFDESGDWDDSDIM